MKVVLRILMLIAIALLVYLCVQSILTPIDFKKQLETREHAIVASLIKIREAQIGFKNVKGVYAANFDELKKFLTEEQLYFLTKEGELTDEQLKAGMTEQEAVKKGLIRRDTTWVLAKDTLLGRDFDVSLIGTVPGFSPESFTLDTATISSPSGYTVPVFQSTVSYDVYLQGLDHQLVVNLKDKQKKLNRFLGLRVGSIEEINNNAGNWE